MTDNSNLDELVKQNQEALDAHTRESVQWHFNPETGSPYWLEKAKSFDFNPLTDVNCFEDLNKFPLFEDDELRGGPLDRWIPKALLGKPTYVFETGG
ncbi:MAG TPA: hypothetical protein DCY03_31305, partial [Planctomycetaceae bacterium]|nr:hypothetical protein [Planctomycetaceae bacterium]